MQLPLDEEFIKWAAKTVGEARFLSELQAELQILVARSEFDTQTKLLDHHKVRDLWQRGFEKGVIAGAGRIARCVRVLGIPIRIHSWPRPWHECEKNSEIAVVLGERKVRIDEVSKRVKQRAVGARDAKAQTELADHCYRRLRLECSLIPHHVDSGLSRDEAVSRLNELRACSNVGMICVIGSPVVNPLAAPIAEAILRDVDDGGPVRAPARFRWAHHADEEVLSEKPENRRSSSWPVGKQGIYCEDSATGLFPRVPDDHVIQAIEAGADETKIFKDCGLLMIDCRQRPVLVLCAGHGGCGTLACVQQLRQTGPIAELIETAADENRAPLGADRLCAIVEVDRAIGPGMVQHKSPVDDLQIIKSRIAWASTIIDSQEWD